MFRRGKNLIGRLKSHNALIGILCKRKWKTSVMLDNMNSGKTIGKIGVDQCKSNVIPMEVVLENGNISVEESEILNKWVRDFSSLFNAPENETKDDDELLNNHDILVHSSSPLFNDHISILEVKQAIDKAKSSKACGIDNIPCEVLKNDTSISFLHILFNIYFETGTVSSVWGKCIISPIPKSSTIDRRDPLSYRGIVLASSMYKLYILNV